MEEDEEREKKKEEGKENEGRREVKEQKTVNGKRNQQTYIWLIISKGKK